VATLPLLYTYRRCPYAMRARIALIQAEIGFDAFEIVLRHKPDGLLAASPKGTVPVLVLPDGAVIEESLDIMRWALQAHDQPALRSCWQAAQTSENTALLTLNDGAFKHHLDRYKYPEKFAAEDRAVHREAALDVFVQLLEKRLMAAEYLGGQQACAADWTIFPFIRQFRAVDEAWFDALPLPAVQTWLQRWLASELFADCMKKLPPQQRVRF
jgi:glutathione S-transferase